MCCISVSISFGLSQQDSSGRKDVAGLVLPLKYEVGMRIQERDSDVRPTLSALRPAPVAGAKVEVHGTGGPGDAAPGRAAGALERWVLWPEAQ